MKTTTKAVTVASLAILMIMIGTLSSCKKSGSNNSNSSTSASVSLLTSARWTFQKYEYQQPDGTWIPDPDAVDADKFTIGFNADNTTSEFDIAFNHAFPGTWAFSSNNTVITTTGNADLTAAAYTVNTLNSSTLVLTELNYFTTGGYTDVRMTFTH